MTTHAEARQLAVNAFAAVIGRVPTLTEVQALCAVGFLETRYGDAWKGAGVGSHNIGAIQSSRGPTNPETEFSYTDTHPNADGSSTPYAVNFRKYPTAAKGWEDLVRVMYVKRPTVLAAASRGDFYAVSAALRYTGYYEGFGKTQEERIANHHRALYSGVQAAAKACGTTLPSVTTDVDQPPGPGEPTGTPQPEAFDLSAAAGVQRALNALGCGRPPLKLDGDFATKSIAALGFYEGGAPRHEGDTLIDVTGKFPLVPATRAAMERDLIELGYSVQ